MRLVAGIRLAPSHLRWVNPTTPLLPESVGVQEVVSLDLSGRDLYRLPRWISSLENLRSLDLRRTAISELPEWLGNLANLEFLYVSSNELRILPRTLTKLKLQELHAANNQLTGVPGELMSNNTIQRLGLANNLIVELPFQIAEMKALHSLDISENPLRSPPLEIAKQGVSAIRAFFSEVAEECLREAKVLFVGEGGAGKSSILRRLVYGDFSRSEEPTQGIQILSWQSDIVEIPTKLHLWDFGGQEIMHAMHQFFLSERSLYILVLDGRKEEDPEYWLEHVAGFGGTSPIVVVLNKTDENPSFEVNRKFLHSKYPAIESFVRVSCLSGDGIEQLGLKIAAALRKVELLESRWPKTWFALKHRIEEKQGHYLRKQEYCSLCVESGVESEDAQMTLLRYLHDLGTIVNFAEFDLEDVFVLEPYWLTRGVYAILTSPRVAASGGMLDTAWIADILEELDEFNYEWAHQKYLVEIMKKFELCYPVSQRVLLIPDLLPIEEPEFESSPVLQLEIDYDFLPPSIVPRFIVKEHLNIKNELRWRTGAVLRSSEFEAEAVVRADRHGRRLFIDLSGPGRREYVTALLASLREIHRRYDSISPREVVRLPDGAGRVSIEHLLNLQRMGLDEFVPEGASRPFRASAILGMVQVGRQRTVEELLQLVRAAAVDTLDESILAEAAHDIFLLQPKFLEIGEDLDVVFRHIRSGLIRSEELTSRTGRGERLNELTDLLDTAISATNSREKGQSLERFAIAFLSNISGFKVSSNGGGLRTKNEQIDVAVQVVGRWHHSTYGPFTYCECKNWSTRVRAGNLSDFFDKLLERSCKYGIFIALGGVTNGFRARVKSYLQRGVIISLLTRKELERIRAGVSPEAILRDSYYHTVEFAGEKGDA